MCLAITGYYCSIISAAAIDEDYYYRTNEQYNNDQPLVKSLPPEHERPGRLALHGKVQGNVSFDFEKIASSPRPEETTIGESSIEPSTESETESSTESTTETANDSETTVEETSTEPITTAE